MSIIVEVRGLRRTLRETVAFAGIIEQEIQRAMPAVQQIAFESFRRQFLSRGREFGLPFRSLTLATVRRKAAAGVADPARPLVRSGALERSLSRRGARGSRTQQKPKALSIASTIEAYGEDGGGLVTISAAAGRRVAHPLTGIAGRGLRDLEKLWEDVADRALRRSGLRRR